MLTLDALLAPDRCLCQQQLATNKKQLFELISQRIANSTGLKQNSVLTALQTRERLGSTYISDGIAIPHARIKGLEAPIASVITNAHPIAFDEDADEQLASLVITLLVPLHADNQHLNALALIANHFKQIDHRNQALSATTDSTLFHGILSNSTQMENQA